MGLKKRKETMEKTKVVPFPSSEWMEELDFRKDGTLKATIYNYATVLENDPLFQCIRKDVLTGEYCAEPDGEEHVYGTQNTVFFIRMLMCKKYGTDNAKLVSEALNDLSRKKPEMEINPIKNYLESLEWDGKPRLASVMEEYFGVQNTALNQRMVLSFMVSAVHRAIEPGCKNDYCLILVGAQGMGKSLFVKKIGKRWGSDTLATLHNHNACCNAGAKEQIAGQLNNTVNEVVVNQIFADLLLCTTTVHNAGKTDDGCRTVWSQPTQTVHNESKICLTLRSKYPGRSEARIINQKGILVTCPLDGVRGIRDNQFKGFVIPVLGTKFSVSISATALPAAALINLLNPKCLCIKLVSFVII